MDRPVAGEEGLVFHAREDASFQGGLESRNVPALRPVL
jgi:hypothetical protein